jgi:hypothetical protein
MAVRASWSPAQRPLAAALVLLVLSLTAYATLRLAFGERPAHVNVRWAPAVDQQRRHELEQRYQLRQGSEASPRTFRYELSDLSTGNIRALVLDPSVEDTSRIHRTAFRIGRLTPRGRYAGRGATWGPLLEAAAVLLLIAALAVGVVRNPGMAIGAAVRTIARWIPEASAEAVALFRMAFGIAVVATTCFPPQAGSPPWLRPLLGAAGILFIGGAAARVAYVLLAIGTLVWAMVVTTGSSHHPVAALLLCMLCLLGSRWSDAWSVDAWWRRRRGAALARRERAFSGIYGYTIWVPGFVMGVAFAAAAVAKLRDSGIAWVLNGTVKYHFLSDAHAAPLDWGLHVGRYPWLAVALSLGAIAIEALIIVGACSRSYRYRGLAGIAGAAILSGFGLFQGVVWPGWWVLLLSFLPWHRVHGRAAAAPAASTPSRREWILAGLVVGLAGQQLIVSGLRLEARPFLSTYDMYATTYDSPEDYVAKSGSAYWIVSGDGRECRVERSEAEVVAATTSTAIPSVSAILRRCFGEAAAAAAAVTVEKRDLAMDWERWEVGGQRRTRLR